MPTKDRYSQKKRWNYRREYYQNNKKKLLKYYNDRYSYLISGRLNPTKNTFNRGVFVISFD